jgi:hypothetical protein
MTTAANRQPGFVEQTALAATAMTLATLDFAKDYLQAPDPCLRAASAYYLHLLTHAHDMYAPETVLAVRQSLEACWEKEQNLGVLIMLEQCLDGCASQPRRADAARRKNTL